MALPDLTRRLAERLLAAYCDGLCAPAPGARVALGYRIDAGGATLFERRRICGVPGTQRPVDVARLAYDAARGDWQLYANDDYGAERPRWRRYTRAGRQPSLARLLREIDADPGGAFWPQLNGASLRWCTTRGRCAECRLRYRAVLGAG